MSNTVDETVARIFSELEKGDALNNNIKDWEKERAVELVTQAVREGLDHFKEMTVDGWMKDELADMEMLYKHCSAAYYYMTDGECSAPNTRPEDVIAINERLMDIRDQEVRDEEHEVKVL